MSLAKVHANKQKYTKNQKETEKRREEKMYWQITMRRLDTVCGYSMCVHVCVQVSRVAVADGRKMTPELDG